MGQKRLLVVRSLLNVVGGILTFSSIALPWLLVNGNPLYAVQLGMFPFLLIGGTISLFSRYGGLLTLAGNLVFSIGGVTFNCPAGGCYIVSGPGGWLAWAGAAVSLAGRSRNSPSLLLSKMGFRIKG